MSDNPESSGPEPAEQTFSGDKVLTTPEQQANPELAETIRSAHDAFSKLISSGDQYAHPFKRDIVNLTYSHDERGEYTHRNKVDHGMGDMKTIDLWVPDSVDPDSVYKYSLSYKPGDLRSLMLSLESPSETKMTPVEDLLSASARATAGVNIQRHRFQDALIVDGANEVPVRETHFTHVYDYEPIKGSATEYKAPQELVDTWLGQLADAEIVQNGKRVARLTDTVPEFAELSKHQ